MADIRPILVDETMFVFLARNDGSFLLKTELARFMEKCIIHKAHRTYRAYATKNVKRRLGFGWIYNTVKNTFTRNTHKREMLQKRLERRLLARRAIVSFLGRRKFRIKPFRWALMDLHLFANENKRATLKRNLEPHEVISLEMCANALIAHETGYPLFSFNEDYQYFLLMPGGKKPFMQYWKPDDVLRTMHI